MSKLSYTAQSYLSQLSESNCWQDAFSIITSAIETDNEELPTILINSVLQRPFVSDQKLNAQDEKDLRQLGERIFEADWFAHLDSALTRQTLKQVAKNLMIRQNLSTLYQAVKSISLLLCFRKENTYPISDCVYDEIIRFYLSILSRPALLSSRSKEIACQHILALELVVWDYIQSRESQRTFSSAMKDMAYHSQLAGSAISPAQEFSVVSETTVPRVAFLLFSVGLLAHSEVLLMYLRALSAQNANQIEPYIFVLGERPETAAADAFESAFKPHVTAIRYRTGTGNDLMYWLPRQCNADNITAAVWVSLPIEISFWTAYRIAPVHVWWSMKYHDLELEGLDGYLAIGSFNRYRKFGTRQWRAVRSATPPLFNSDKTDAAHAVANKYKSRGDEILIGSIARDVRYQDESYAAAIVEILKRCPNAHYFWTGRNELRSFAQNMADAGVGDRCHYLGWVDTEVWAQALDVYVDTFPFASGKTAIEAMAARVPLVVLRTPEALETSAAMLFTPFIEKEAGTPEEQERVAEIYALCNDMPTHPLVDSVSDYVERAVSLINDTEYRRVAGVAGHAFYEEFLRNEQGFAEGVTQHLLEIINEKCSSESTSV